MKKTATFSSLMTLICIALLFLINYSTVFIIAGYGICIFGILSIAAWLSVAINHFKNKEGKKDVSIYLIFAVTDVVTASCLGIHTVINDTGFMSGLATAIYLIFILPMFVGLLVIDLFVWLYKTKRLTGKVLIIVNAICFILAVISFIRLSDIVSFCCIFIFLLSFVGIITKLKTNKWSKAILAVVITFILLISIFFSLAYCINNTAH